MLCMVYRLEGQFPEKVLLLGNDIVLLLVYNLDIALSQQEWSLVALPSVFVTRRIPEAGLALLSGHCEVDLWPEPLPPPYETLVARSKDCEGILSLLTDKIDEKFLAACPKLKVVSNFAVGFNNIDVPAATAKGVRIGNTPGVLTDATADIAFCLLIGAARRLVEGHLYSQSGDWKTWEPLGHIGLDLVGKTVGIVGMGRIGYAMAKRCHGGWGMKVLYTNLEKHEEAEKLLGAKRVELDELLPACDFVSVHVDLNATTKHLFNAARFKQMKKTAVFINTARGPIHDEPALYDALKNGTIFAAGLDVTDPEPPDPNNPLLRLPNVIVAPHIASATVATRNAMATIAAENLLAGLAGRPLRHCVNP